ncbi:peroxiredoxin [Brevundimonas aveniformis]|uniref:peroxiredoxin n=1 Tax=Brevundimonas aveniformis TaxID=370977 RepID=UPI002490C0C4|nr:peroxiredoxin [Brevundimonas aveniformis]
MTELTEGQKAPALDLPTDDGGQFDLARAGGPVVVFFYPKADTPGCTVESQDFSALKPDFDKLGVQVIGVSRDPVKKLARFRAKHGLTVLLGSDEAGTVTEAWGVWVQKQLYGRTYMGIERATALVGPDGRLARVWRKVSVKGHATEVLAATTRL